MIFKKIKSAISNSLGADNLEDEYIEIDLEQKEKENKVLVKLFVMKHYDDINQVLNSIREGYTIAIIDIKDLKAKDMIELKRAISKLKKTTDALEGNIAQFRDNTLIVTPSFAKIHKEEFSKPKEEDKFHDF